MPQAADNLWKETAVRILVVEDDPEMGRLLTKWLREQGFDNELATNGVDGLIAAQSGAFTAAAIDVMIPGMTGFELSRRIREGGSTMPIILLTARDAIDDRVRGLDSGADDYLIKPFDFAELGARLRSLLRREAGQRTTVIVGQLELDSMSMQATLGGERVTLSVKEFIILRLLAASAGSLVSRATILEEVWGSVDFIAPNIVDQYISILRRKIGSERSDVRITTVRRQGFVLDVI
jgi:two-component system, OmpR family, response regulator